MPLPLRRLAVLVSADYGELSNALNFAQPPQAAALLLLPGKLWAANQGTLPCPAVPYAGPDDVLAAIDAWQADAVLLFSGYLLVVNGLFDLPGFDGLLAALRQRRIALATSDPFLGLMQDHASDPAEVILSGHPGRAALAAVFGPVARALHDLPHLYSAPMAGRPGRWRAGYFGPGLVDTPAQAAGRPARLQQWLGMDTQTPYWLFVLASEDHGIQTALHGSDRFAALLQQRLLDAVRAGRRAVLVAPAACLATLPDSLAAHEGLRIVGFCAQAAFCDLVTQAEHCFYWNLVSNSILLRLANQRPLFLFHRGHLVHSMPTVLDKAVATYFAGTDPDLLDMHEPLDPGLLQAMALGRREPSAYAAILLRQLLPPGDLLHALQRHWQAEADLAGATGAVDAAG